MEAIKNIDHSILSFEVVNLFESWQSDVSEIEKKLYLPIF